MREAAKKTSLLAVLLLACACATPIGVTHVNTQSMYRSVTSSVLSAGQPSQYSEQLLTRLGLGERFDTDPELALAALRGPGEGLSREYLFVLSELSFYHAVKSQKPEYFLASAVYAWAFVAGKTDEVRVDPLDPRFRLAANLYNLGLAQGLAGAEEATVVLAPGTRRLPFGRIEISVDESMLLWSGYRMTRFISRASSRCAASSTATGRPASARRSRRSWRQPARGPRPRRRGSGFLRDSRCR
jgi:hypothetical protein